MRRPYSSKGVLVRWTFGETKARETSPQAFDMLGCSMRFMRVVLPNADLAICHNNASREGLSRLSTMAEENGARLVDASDLLPSELRNVRVKNSWWKYAPARLAPSRYEIVMDNDVVLWSVPPTLRKAIGANQLVALTDGAGQFYGDFLGEVKGLQPDLRLNAGLLGMPPDFGIELKTLGSVRLSDFFHSEQGFAALSYIRYAGKKCLIPLMEVPQLNAVDVSAETLVASHHGGHFCGCSYGHFNFWERKYSREVKAKLSYNEANCKRPRVNPFVN